MFYCIHVCVANLRIVNAARFLSVTRNSALAMQKMLNLFFVLSALFGAARYMFTVPLSPSKANCVCCPAPTSRRGTTGWRTAGQCTGWHLRALTPFLWRSFSPSLSLVVYFKRRQCCVHVCLSVPCVSCCICVTVYRMSSSSYPLLLACVSWATSLLNSSLWLWLFGCELGHMSVYLLCTRCCHCLHVWPLSVCLCFCSCVCSVAPRTCVCVSSA